MHFALLSRYVNRFLFLQSIHGYIFVQDTATTAGILASGSFL